MNLDGFFEHKRGVRCNVRCDMLFDIVPSYIYDGYGSNNGNQS